MRRILTMIILLVVLLTSAIAFAQDGFPKGYEIVYTAPEEGMHPRDYKCNMVIYDAASGGLIRKIVPAVVDGYVIWYIPSRPADYYVSIWPEGSRSWTIMSRETLDAICK